MGTHPSITGIEPLGDSSVLVHVGGEGDVAGTLRAMALSADELTGVSSTSCGHATLLVGFDPLACDRQVLIRELEDALAHVRAQTTQARVVELPVCYEGEWAADLERVAACAGLSCDEVVAIHASGSYQVAMVGFTPGFGYLTGLDPRIATPRLEVPRANVVAGSVGIAGDQTGAYPLDSPGGWNIIGHTPVALWRPCLDEPSLLRGGDTVRFSIIDASEHDRLLQGEVRP